MAGTYTTQTAQEKLKETLGKVWCLSQFHTSTNPELLKILGTCITELGSSKMAEMTEESRLAKSSVISDFCRESLILVRGNLSDPTTNVCEDSTTPGRSLYLQFLDIQKNLSLTVEKLKREKSLPGVVHFWKEPLAQAEALAPLMRESLLENTWAELHAADAHVFAPTGGAGSGSAAAAEDPRLKLIREEAAKIQID